MGKSRKRSKLSHTTGYPYKSVKSPSDRGTGHPHEHASFAASPLFISQGQLACASDGDLKRLAFLRNYSGYCVNKGYSLASSVYMTGRSLAPARLDSGLKTVEQTITGYSMPLVTAVQDQSLKALSQLDQQVDGAILMARQLLSSKQVDQSQQLAKVHEPQTDYTESVQESMLFLKQHGFAESARHVADLMLGRLDMGKQVLNEEAEDIAHRFAEAWSKVASLPPVAKVVSTAQPPVEYTRNKYREAHEAIVSSPVYNRALDIADDLVRRVQDTFVYQTAANRLYPVIGPIADPALDKLTHSPVYTAVKDHFKPHTIADQPLPAICAQC